MTRPRVVLADDRASMARQLRALLLPSCDVVEVVSDGAALVAAVDALEPDVIVTDIAMPGVSGMAAARIIRSRHPAARVIFLTIRDEPELIREAAHIGALGYVMKGDAGDELAIAVHAAMAGVQYVSTSARAVWHQGDAPDSSGDKP